MAPLHDTIQPSPHSHEGPRRSSALALGHLATARNSERLVREANLFLTSDPEDFYAHYYLAWALTDLKRFDDAKPHLEFLQQRAPDSVEAHLVAIHWNVSQNRWRAARHHIEEGLRIDPAAPQFHRYAAVDYGLRLKFVEAKLAIAKARELAPDDPDIASLYIDIYGVDQHSTASAVNRVREYEAILALDPENAEVHDSIGQVYLFDLDDPKSAERHFREALRLDPADRNCQKNLFAAVAQRSPVYRLFSLPSRASFGTKALLWLSLRRPWILLFVILGFKFVVIFLIWLVVAAVLFWPGGLIYEWLLVSEIKTGSQGSVTGLRVWRWFQGWPLWTRFTLFLLFNLTAWGVLFAFLNVSLATGYVTVGILAGIHAVVVGVKWAITRLLAADAKRWSPRPAQPAS